MDRDEDRVMNAAIAEIRKNLSARNHRNSNELSGGSSKDPGTHATQEYE
jgi:hypothetical protein